MPVGSSEKFQLSLVAGVLFRILLKLDYKKVVISPLASAMVDDDVWQYSVGRFTRLALSDAHEALLKLPVTVILTVHVPRVEVRLQLDGKTMGRWPFVNSPKIQCRILSLHGLDRNRNSVLHLIVGHDRPFYASSDLW